MPPPCGICGAKIDDLELHLKWHASQFKASEIAEGLPMVHDVEICGEKLRVVESRYYIQAAKRVTRLLDLMERCVMWPTDEKIREVENELGR